VRLSTDAALRLLIEVCHDGCNGYNAAASVVGSTELRRLFDRFANERGQIAGQLARKLGESSRPPQHGTLGAVLHRGWMSLVSSGGSTATILRECTRGEDAALKQFEDVLTLDLPKDVAALVRMECERILDARNRIAELAAEASAD